MAGKDVDVKVVKNEDGETSGEKLTDNAKKKTTSPLPTAVETGKEQGTKKASTPDKNSKPSPSPSPASPAPKVAPKKSKRPTKGEKTDMKSGGNSGKGAKVATSPSGAQSKDPMEKSQISAYAQPMISHNTAKDFQFLEEHLTKLPCFHGFIGREDLTGMLKVPGDYIIRLTVQANKHELEKRKKNVADVKVINNLSREKCAKKEKEREAKMASAGDTGKREFVISVYCRDKEKPAPGKPVFTPIRNLVVKRGDGLVHVEPLKKFKTLPEFFAFYQKNTGVCKETDFQLINPIPLSNWEFQHEEVELLEKKLGEGAFGEVRVGKMKMKDTKKQVEVAVKMLRNSEVVTREQVAELLHEARVMRMMDHKNVLRTYGIAVLHEPLYLMSEMCACGALREYLRDNQKTVTMADKLHFVLGSARGVEYLHTQRIIHRDLAVRNVLLSEDKTPKVSDFGLAKVADRYEMKEQCKIPVRYLAPETLENYVFTTKTDVFSFGCVVWEIYENGQQPHDGKNAKTIRNQTKQNKFLKLMPPAPAELCKLIQDRVFTADPENRCSMTAIVQCVEKIEKPSS